MDWLGREVISTGKDQGSQQSLVLYAGLNQGELPGEEGEAIPLDMTETFAWQTYKVKRGDSVSKIALDFSVSMDAIIASNGITNARSLREGEVLRIPNMDGIPYTVRNGDTLSGISQSMGVPLEAILDANDLQSDVINTGMSLFIPGARMNRDDLKLALGELFVYPVRGARLSSPFGWRNDPFTGVRSHHAGVDLSISQGAPIKAAMDGTVSTLGVDRIYGNYIILSHSSGLQTLYAHLNSFSVKRGDRVLQGVQIGTVGSTGYSTGPHLHFAVFKNGRAVNPLDFLAP
jgi:murein DD-endopeptidase MepM/ murein hydrolase activator NlpD